MDSDIITKTPDQMSKNEFRDFISLILDSGEVAGNGLENRVRKAEHLILLRTSGCLAGIGALKNPNVKYRNHVASASGIHISSSEYPLELGWVFVRSDHRRKGYAQRIAEAALSVANEVGVFATSRCDNPVMHKVLKSQRFVPAGKPYASKRGKYELQLFLRDAPQQSARLA